jgi:hypothetical protein
MRQFQIAQAENEDLKNRLREALLFVAQDQGCCLPWPRRVGLDCPLCDESIDAVVQVGGWSDVNCPYCGYIL